MNKKITLVLAGVAVAIAISFAIVSLISMPSSSDGLVHITDPPKGAAVSVVDAQGFAASRVVATSPSIIKDYVLSPGSTGYVMVEYNYRNATKIPANLSAPDSYVNEINEELASSMIGRLHPDGTVSDVPVNATGLRMYIASSSDLAYVYSGENVDIVRIKYTINSDTSAEKSTYLLPIPHEYLGSPTNLLTIGDEPFPGQTPWA